MGWVSTLHPADICPVCFISDFIQRQNSLCLITLNKLLLSRLSKMDYRYSTALQCWMPFYHYFSLAQ